MYTAIFPKSNNCTYIKEHNPKFTSQQTILVWSEKSCSGTHNMSVSDFQGGCYSFSSVARCGFPCSKANGGNLRPCVESKWGCRHADGWILRSYFDSSLEDGTERIKLTQEAEEPFSFWGSAAPIYAFCQCCPGGICTERKPVCEGCIEFNLLILRWLWSYGEGTCCWRWI